MEKRREIAWKNRLDEFRSDVEKNKKEIEQKQLRMFDKFLEKEGLKLNPQLESVREFNEIFISKYAKELCKWGFFSKTMMQKWNEEYKIFLKEKRIKMLSEKYDEWQEEFSDGFHSRYTWDDLNNMKDWVDVYHKEWREFMNIKKKEFNESFGKSEGKKTTKVE